jgi:phosphatidylglycerol lysyltransferase
VSPATAPDYLPEEAPRLLALLRRFGWNATSFQVLEPGFRYWFDGDDGCVAFVDTGGAWVAAGTLIAVAERLREVVGRFVAAARAKGRRAVFFAVEPRFLHDAEFPSLRVGEQPVWDPASWEKTLRSSKSLREQVRRAKAKGVRPRALGAAEVGGAGSEVRRGIDALIERWVASRQMAQMGFLVELHPFALPEERRYFVAEQGGRVLGFLAVVPVYERGGWFCEDLLRDPAAPNGTAELLVDLAMRSLAAEGSRYVTLGLAPLAGDIAPALRAARWLGSRLYDFEGLRSFKARLRPDRWDPIYLAWPAAGAWWGGALARNLGAPLAIFETLRAFARGGLLRFGVQSLTRVPNFVVQALAVLLVPWTLAVASVSTARWFPSPWVKLAWVLLDGAIVVALLRLGSRWQHRAATAIACVVTLDAVLTLAQAVAFNAPRARSPWEQAVLAVAVAAPSAAAAALWRARFLRERLARTRHPG